jgi:hypothetical protein
MAHLEGRAVPALVGPEKMTDRRMTIVAYTSGGAAILAAAGKMPAFPQDAAQVPAIWVKL